MMRRWWGGAQPCQDGTCACGSQSNVWDDRSRQSKVENGWWELRQRLGRHRERWSWRALFSKRVIIIIIMKTKGRNGPVNSATKVVIPPPSIPSIHHHFIPLSLSLLCSFAGDNFPSAKKTKNHYCHFFFPCFFPSKPYHHSALGPRQKALSRFLFRFSLLFLLLLFFPTSHAVILLERCFYQSLVVFFF